MKKKKKILPSSDSTSENSADASPEENVQTDKPLEAGTLCDTPLNESVSEDEALDGESSADGEVELEHVFIEVSTPKEVSSRRFKLNLKLPSLNKEHLKKLLKTQATKTVVSVLLIFAVAILIVSAVNIAKLLSGPSAATQKQIAIMSIFDRGTHSELYETLEDGREIYLVYKNDALMGYCVSLSTDGYKGEIDLVVGIDATLSTYGVRVVSSSETQGVGAKVKSGEFLERFIGLSHDDIEDKVDIIAGATVSSDAVKAGVISALETELDLGAIAAEKAIVLLMPDEFDLEESITMGENDSDESENETTDETSNEENSVEASTDTATDGTASQESGVDEETTDAKFVHNGGEKYHDYVVESATVDDKYIIEVPKEDESETSTEQK